MRRWWAKGAACFRMYLTDIFIYRGAAFIWLIADSLTSLLLPLVWIAAANGKASVGPMRVNDIVVYYIGALVVSQFTTSHIMWDLSAEIREGVFSIHLVRPISFFYSQFMRNAAWRVAKIVLFVPVFVMMVVAYWGYLGGLQLHMWGLFILAVLLGQALSYVSAFALAMIALRTQETQAIIRLYYLPEQFLSGRLFPLALLPGWAGVLALYTPFRFTIAFPLDILLGRLDAHAIAVGFAVQLGWMLFMALAARVLWRTGLQQYTGVGM